MDVMHEKVSRAIIQCQVQNPAAWLDDANAAKPEGPPCPGEQLLRHSNLIAANASHADVRPPRLTQRRQLNSCPSDCWGEGGMQAEVAEQDPLCPQRGFLLKSTWSSALSVLSSAALSWILRCR